MTVTPVRLPAAMTWTLHGDGTTVAPGAVVAPHERLSWPRTIGIGTQHVLAMAGSTLIVPALTGFPPATTLLFSGLGTMIFLLLTRGRVPSYLGSSFAFIAPITAAKADHGIQGALGGLVVTGAILFLVGVIVQRSGTQWIEKLMPPVVTGTIVALIGLNLAPAAKSNLVEGPASAVVTIAVILFVSVFFRGLLGRLSILVGVAAGYGVAALRGEIDYTAVSQASWIGLPEFATPTFHLSTLGLFIPVVLVLIAENVGHVKSVALMTGSNLDSSTGRALMADGLATVVAGSAGGSGTTTYAENIGVMASSRVYSTAAYWVAGATAILLSVFPKVGAVISAMPLGVLGGAGVVLYGMIGVLGARIWVDNRVSFADPVNLMTAGVGLVIAIADVTWQVGSLQFGGIALGTGAALLVFHGMRAIGTRRGTLHTTVIAGPDNPLAADSVTQAPRPQARG